MYQSKNFTKDYNNPPFQVVLTRARTSNRLDKAYRHACMHAIVD